MKKNLLLLTFLITLFFSCDNNLEECNSCKSYYDAIEKGNAQLKKSSIIVNQSTLELDFVRLGESKDRPYCYGRLYSKNSTDFKNLIYSFTDKYNVEEEIFGIELFGEKYGFCDGVSLLKEDVKSLLIYRFANDKIYADIINLKTANVQVYEIFDIRSSTSHYVLFNKGEVNQNHVLARITNPNFKYKITFDKNKKGVLYQQFSL